MDDLDRRQELKRFLKERRSRVLPSDVGLSSLGRRRVPGLRREEVALLAGIGVSWYTALENGEDRNFSDATVQAVADVLRLNESEREYLLSLVIIPTNVEQLESPTPLILSAMHSITYPSYVITAEWNVLAFNKAFARVWSVVEAELPFNALQRLFIRPQARKMHGNHFKENVAPVVAMVRSGLARRPELLGLHTLRDLILDDADLRSIWNEGVISDPLAPTTCTIDSTIGPFTYEALTLPITEKLLAIVVQVPGSLSQDRLAKASRLM